MCSTVQGHGLQTCKTATLGPQEPKQQDVALCSTLAAGTQTAADCCAKTYLQYLVWRSPKRGKQQDVVCSRQKGPVAFGRWVFSDDRKGIAGVRVARPISPQPSTVDGRSLRSELLPEVQTFAFSALKGT